MDCCLDLYGPNKHQYLDENGLPPSLLQLEDVIVLPQPVRDIPPRHRLCFKRVSYTVPPLCIKRPKVILKSVSGVMRPGLNAILGPTGSGKTTLLGVLSGRKAISRTGGILTYNSCAVDKNFKFQSGYVIQEDIVAEALTVRENLTFSTMLRLPIDTPNHVRTARVQSVIDELHLNQCADTRIGNSYLKGVSGGEKRRTSIGMELVTNPKIVFMDEPTSGLDSFSAKEVIITLKGLTMIKEIILVISLHQPRYSIFKLLDTVTLLSCGRLAYHGPRRDMLEYFKKLGFRYRIHNNPADFILDIVECPGLHASSRYSYTSSSQSSNLPLHRCISINDETLDQLLISSTLEQHFESSEANSRLQKDLQQLHQLIDNRILCQDNSICYNWSDKFVTNSCWQLYALLWKSISSVRKNPLPLLVQILVMFSIASVIGVVYFQIPDSPEAMKDKLGVMFFIILAVIFGNITSVDVFLKTKIEFLHESSSGLYRTSVFFLCKALMDFIIYRLIPLLVFTPVSYFLIGFTVSWYKVFVYYVTLSLVVFCGIATSFTISIIVTVFGTASLIFSLKFALYMLFAGVLVGLTSLPSWCFWLKYVSILRHATEALAINEFGDQFYLELVHNNNVDARICIFKSGYDSVWNNTLCVVSGEAFLRFQGYSPSAMWYNEVALAGYGSIWMIFTYILLIIMKQTSRRLK